MSKYNLTDILNEFIGGGRIGTLKISFKDLQDKMDDLENSGKVIVRTLPGPSGDGKVNREFEVVDRDSAVPGGNKQEKGFTVYDYKFGFDPGSEEHFMEEYPFSVGGNDLQLAMDLIDGVEPFRIREEKEEMKEDKEKDLINALRFQVMTLEKGIIDKDDFINAIEELAFGQRRGPMQEEDVDEVMGVDRKGRKKPDYKSNLTNIDEADNIEVVALLNNIRKHLNDKFDRKYSKSEIDLYMDSLKRDIKRGEFDEVKSMSMEDHEENFENYIADRSLQEHFQRFM